MPEPRIGALFQSATELKEEIALVNGNLPSWLKGTYLRTGPGVYDFAKGFNVNHVFDGYAILTKFDIKGEKVKLQKKYLESDAYKRATTAQKPLVCEFGTRAYTDPSKSFFSRMIPSIIPELSDNGNIGMFNIGKHTFACGEVCYFHEIDKTTLTNTDRFDSQKLFGCQLLSSHPITDLDGTTYNIGISFLTGLKYNIIKMPPPTGNQRPKDMIKQAKILSTISSSNNTNLSYVHSFGLSSNYIVYIEQPYVLCVSKVLAAAVKKGDCLQDWLEWRPEMKNKFVIVNKHTGKVFKTEYTAKDPFFFLHIINCYEENDQIILDLTAFNNVDFLNSLTLTRLREGDTDIGENGLPRGFRFVLPLVDIKETPEEVDLVGVKSTATAIRKGNQISLTPEIYTEGGLEFPTFNRQFLSKKFSYYYATGSLSVGYFQNSLCKVDVRNKDVTLWRENEYCYYGEPLFIPRPNGTTEDDGVVLVAVSNTRSNDSNDYLLCLDAKSMSELGRVQFHSKIPQASHGVFVFSD